MPELTWVEPGRRAELDQGGGGRVVVVATDRSDGDLAPGLGPAPVVGAHARWQRLRDRPWSWLRQVHGGRVVTVVGAGGAAGTEADGAVTASADATLAVFVADCAPVALVSADGPVGVAHAGWRGLAAGIVEEAVTRLRETGAGERVDALVGPHIGPCCYEFGAGDLAGLVERYGPGVAGRTRAGAPSLDVGAAVRAALAAAGVATVLEVGECTACRADRYWSHRARRDVERQAVVVWRQPR